MRKIRIELKPCTKLSHKLMKNTLFQKVQVIAKFLDFLKFKCLVSKYEIYLAVEHSIMISIFSFQTEKNVIFA